MHLCIVWILKQTPNLEKLSLQDMVKVDPEILGKTKIKKGPFVHTHNLI